MQQHYQSQILDHLGLVAGMYDELEIGAQIDEAIHQDLDERIVSIGQAVKAMVLNGLGFADQRLYLVPSFFETKPTERLIGGGILPEHLNDDTLGRALDSLYDYGVTELFRDVAAHAAARLGLKPQYAHIDSTSFHVHGVYNSEADSPEAGTIHIRPGYSRDHRGDLNQVMLDLVVERRAALPVLMKPLSGNSSDQVDFTCLIERHIDHLQQAHGVDFLVADSALYSADAIQKIDGRGGKFITRVPETTKEAKQAIREVDLEAMEPLAEGYRYTERISDYGGVKHRWLIVFSEAAHGRAQKRVRRQFDRQKGKEEKALANLAKRSFSCREDAEKAIQAFSDTLKATTAESVQVLECIHVNGVDGSMQPDRVSYRIRGELVLAQARLERQINRKSLFILATNELRDEVLSPADILAGYKGQARVERGFRFLKDPMFLASSLYLKNEKRIMALLMVMTLCLLVYAALEYRIREGLRAQGKSFPDQKGKPMQRPTARWVFERFVGIHVLLVAGQELVLNLKERHETIIAVLGARYVRYYRSPPT
jgi:transposase